MELFLFKDENQILVRVTKRQNNVFIHRGRISQIKDFIICESTFRIA